MNQRVSKVPMLDRRQQKKDRDYKIRWQNTEAELGWTKARHAKKLHGLTHELNRQRRGTASREAEVRGWQSKFEGLDMEHVALKEEMGHLRGHLTKYINENKQLEKQAVQTRDVVLQLYQQQAPSRMAASVYSDESTDELLALLQERLKTTQATNKKHQKKVQRMQDALDSEKQRNTELLQGLNDKDMANPRPPKAAGDQTMCFFGISSKLSTIQQWLDERIDHESKSCGHSDAGAVSLTACNVLLCESCHQDMLSCRMLVKWHVRKCPYCPRQCVLLPLPKLVTRPTNKETMEMQDIMRLVQQDLSELIGGPSADD
ncbi:hypothetical protein LTR51_005916 [Lithohypha guttulata]|nr:hypothetical protein LTR51_005916 [Lithohypha guttulata]